MADRTKVFFYDTEYSNKVTYKRMGNPFNPANFVTAVAWRKTREPLEYRYYTEKSQVEDLPLSDCRGIVLLNAKADLFWWWRSPEMLDFLRAEGWLWDCQYAEYLMTGHMMNMKTPKDQRPSMENIYSRYRQMDIKAGNTDILEYDSGKMEEVKLLWEAGVDTPDIPQDLLMEYLCGTDNWPGAERPLGKKILGDVPMTEYIFSRQVKRAQQLGMLEMIRESMDSLLCTVEMEYNGIYMDWELMKRQKADLEVEERELRTKLDAMLPEFPEGLTFNWGSGAQVSALLYGGPINYDIQVPQMKDGEVLTVKEDVVWPCFVDPQSPRKAIAVDPDYCRVDEETGYYLNCDIQYGELTPKVYKSGEKQGQQADRKVKVDTGKPRMKKGTAQFYCEGYGDPHKKWKTAQVTKVKDNYTGEVLEEHEIYKTGDDQVKVMAKKGVPFCQTLRDWRAVDKNLGTYYERDGKGLMTMVNQYSLCVNHQITNCVTKTGRLASQNPNCQNIPGLKKSEIRRAMVSRFGDDGYVMEPDYSQLEVVGQQVNSGDEALERDLLNGVCFHCKRLALKEGMDYDEVYRLCKVDEVPEWVEKRKQIKGFSFQMQYGAGASSIAESTGMKVKEVEALFAVEEEAYPGVVDFQEEVMRQAEATRRPTNNLTDMGFPQGVGYYTHPTGIRFVFHEVDAPKWMKEQYGKMTCFYRPHTLNFPTQGGSGYFVRLALGKLFRHWVKMNWYSDEKGFDTYWNDHLVPGIKPMAYLCNTVHDCIWSDTHKSIFPTVATDMKNVMEGIPTYLKESHGMEVTVPFPVEVEYGPNMGDMKVYHDA